MPSVTGYYNGPGQGANNFYVDIIICKWELNSISTRAFDDCSRAGALYTLDSMKYIPYFQTTPTNDSAMINKYISFSADER